MAQPHDYECEPDENNCVDTCTSACLQKRLGQKQVCDQGDVTD